MKTEQNSEGLLLKTAMHLRWNALGVISPIYPRTLSVVSRASTWQQQRAGIVQAIADPSTSTGDPTCENTVDQGSSDEDPFHDWTVSHKNDHA